jgi:trehalose/maltose hydrolase-like predicted phosphorylase
MSNLIYDNNWLITLSNIEAIDMSSYNGPFSGNGKIGLYASMSNIGTDKTYVSGNLNFNQIGKYRNNMIEGFNMHTIKLFHNLNSNISYNFQHQSLDMSSGKIASRFTVESNNINMIDVTHTLVPLRQFPYCTLQTVEMTLLSDVPTLDVFHEMSGDARFISEMDFNNNVIYNERIYDDKGLYILNATGNVSRIGQDGKPVRLAGAACYLFEGASSNNVKNLGFNSYNNLSSCYQKHRYTDCGNGDVIRFHILGSQMTSMDFSEPIEEIKRMLLNIAFKNENISSLITQINNDNVAGWNNLWQSDILLEPKTGITTDEANSVKRVKQYIRYSLYQIFSCIRDGINTEINPLNLSYLDANGNIFFDGDLWMVPVLLFLKPAMAKTILEFRYKNLEQATQLAASFGYKGSKYPYQNDVLGYQSMYWDVISPLHIFNNALIAVNVWNYYRITLDKEWLSTKGYAMMRNIADFLVSVITIDESGNYNYKNTVGMSERISDNHAFTVYMAKLALKYTIEATYELNFAAKTSWINGFLNSDIETFTGSNCSIIKYDDVYNGEALDVLDNLIILNPYYSNLYFNPNYQCRDSNAIKNNINYYNSKITPTYENDILNNIILTSLNASVMQNDTNNIDNFYDKLIETLDENSKELWGYFGRVGNNSGNDVSLNAFLLMMFLGNIGGLRVQGGVTESKFYYEEMGIKGTYNANMPSTWKNIKLKGVGPNAELFNVVNNVYYS